MSFSDTLAVLYPSNMAFYLCTHNIYALYRIVVVRIALHCSGFQQRPFEIAQSLGETGRPWIIQAAPGYGNTGGARRELGWKFKEAVLKRNSNGTLPERSLLHTYLIKVTTATTGGSLKNFK